MELNSGDIIGQVLRKCGITYLFTLCGGHISPILAGAKKEGIRVIDVRDEANAVFAADAVARITGIPGESMVLKAADLLATAEKPILIIGSQALLQPDKADNLADAIGSLGIPVFLTGMARGLLGKSHPLLRRHQRRKALTDADLVFIAGMPCDFRLNYGRSFGPGAKIISVNRSKVDLRLNCRPDLPILSDPFLFLCAISETLSSPPLDWKTWNHQLRQNDERHADVILKRS